MFKALSICVFCGSRNGTKAEYKQAASQLGQGMAKRNWRLIYGAGTLGMMGEISQTIIDNWKKEKTSFLSPVIGFIPTHLLERERNGETADSHNVAEIIITDNMHERKKTMFMNCDAIIIMPGGVGTLDEFFEVLTWAQIDIHEKPIVLVNTENFWNPMIALIKHIIQEGFAENTLLDLFKVTQTPEEALNYINGNLN